MSDDWQGVPLETDKSPEKHETLGAGVPHSGDLGLEAPVTEFDKTSLQEAHVYGVLTAPDSPATLLEHMPPLTYEPVVDVLPAPVGRSHNRVVFALGAASAAAVAAVCGLLFLGNNDDSDSKKASVTTVAATDNSTPSPSTETTSTPDTTINEGITGVVTSDSPDYTYMKSTTHDHPENYAYGGMSLEFTDEELGSNYITAIRPNGEEIRVPSSISVETPEKAFKTAFSLWACYMVTGSEDCLNAFVSPYVLNVNDVSLQDYMREIRESTYLPIIEGESALTNYIPNPDLQIVFFDDRNNPAQFTLEDSYLTLAGGTVYVGTYSGIPGDGEANIWQSDETRRFGLAPFYISELEMWFGTSTQGKPEVIKWDVTTENNTNW